MAFSYTTETRLNVMGNLVLMRGTFNADSVNQGQIDCSEVLSQIYACGAMGDTYGDITGGGVDGAFVIHPDSTPAKFIVDCVSGNTGNWWALGTR